MEMTSALDTPCDPERLWAAVADLADYPGWLSIVARAEPTDAAGDEGPAWAVELRGRLGPLARSKRLRMVRTVADAPHHLRFERRELDGRAHSAWVLDAVITGGPGAGRLTMTLHYGGTLGGATLERLLSAEIDQSRPRLLALLADPAA
jgi:hypothetical protein